MDKDSENFGYKYTPSASPDTASTATFNMTVAQEEWAKIQDAAERRKIQNRNAQRKYRKNLKRRVEDLERQNAYIAFTSGTGANVQSATSSPTMSRSHEGSALEDVSPKIEDNTSSRQQSMSPKSAFDQPHGNTISGQEFSMMNSAANNWLPQQPNYVPISSSMQSHHPSSTAMSVLSNQSPVMSTPSTMDHDGINNDALISLSSLNDYIQHNNTILEDNTGSPRSSCNSVEEIQFGSSCPPPCQGFCIPHRGAAPFGRTTLHLAAMKGYLPIVQMLLEKGMDINARDNYGWTPLHLAAERGQQAVVKALLERGADVYARI